MKKRTNLYIRIGERTEIEIQDLVEEFQSTKSHVVRLAVELLWNKFCNKPKVEKKENSLPEHLYNS